MRILIVTQYYWPEYFLINRFSQKLVELNNEVTVATGKPNYPHGELYKGYNSSGIVSEWYEDVEVIRIPLRPRGNGALNLVLNYFSFVYSGFRYLPKILNGRKFDFILVFAPSPITSALPAIWLNRKLKSHLALWVQDLWPQSLDATGYIKNKKILNIVGILVKWIYRNCDTILAQSHAFKSEIEKLTSAEKIFYYPNSIEKTPLSEHVILSQEIMNHFQTGFNLVFTGNIGTAQSIPVWLSVAEKLRDTDCRFIFIGDGSLRAWAEEEAKKLALTNVVFLGWIDNSMMPIIYKYADALLVSLLGKDIFSYTIPGKLQAYLSAGKPIIASIDGETERILNEAKAGIVCPAEDINSLEIAIRKFRLLPQADRDEMGNSGQKYFNDNFDMNILSRHLIKLIKMRIETCKK